MQAEIPPTLKRSSANEQPAHSVMCPLCSTLLTIRDIAPQQTVVLCPACGYSAPYIQRQHHVNEISPVQRQPVGSSVWIDPAVSAYLAGALTGNAKAEHSPSLLHAAPKTRPLNPPTPIPPRASAQRPNAVKVRPKYSRTHTLPLQEEEDLTRIPTLPPPTMWQYESPQFEAESSLSSLSLVIETPTQPQPISAQLELPLPVARPAIQSPKPSQHITDIDEIDTLPEQLTQLSPSPIPEQLSPAASRTVDIDQINTQPRKPPQHAQHAQHVIDIDKIDTLSPRIVASVAPRSNASLVPTHPVLSPTPVRLSKSPTATSNVRAAAAPTEQVISIREPSSWTAGGFSQSAYARRIAERSKARKPRPTMHTLDHVRWWLLHPGRLEGLLWLGGTLLLITVTFALLIVSAISFSWMSPGTQSGTASSLTTPANAPTTIPTVITSHGLTLILENAQLLVPGQPVQLRGQGFSPHGHVTFSDEKSQPLLVQATQSNIVEADQHGMFAVALTTNTWATGAHHIFVRDVMSGHIADIPIMLDAGPFGKKATATVPPGVTPTVTTGSGQGGFFPTPVNSTPVPITPTVSSATPTPAPTQVKPTATPTMGVTPTATPGTTPTVGTTPSPSSSPATNGQSDSTIGTAGITSLGSDSSNSAFSPLGWLLIAGYSLAMLLLGLTALLRKRQN
ncbi:MAG: hypothetical protein ACR2H5_19955 [Ktedonobacteraceae bacterium]